MGFRFPGLGPGAALPPGGPLFPTVTYDTAQNIGAIFYPLTTSPASVFGASGSPIAQVVSGSVVLDGFWDDNTGGTNIPSIGQATLQWLIDGVPLTPGPGGYLPAGVRRGITAPSPGIRPGLQMELTPSERS